MTTYWLSTHRMTIRVTRHGDVEVEVRHFEATGKCTLENKMRERKGLKLLGERR